jgi:ketosteroid isomerase-like protein
MAHKNEKTLRASDAAMTQGNPQPMFDHFTDDAVIHIGGKNKLAGDYKGKDQLMETFGRFMQALGENPSFDTHEVLANDTHGVVLQTARASRGGKSIAIDGIAIFHFDGAGKVTEAWFSDADPYTADPWYDAGL